MDNERADRTLYVGNLDNEVTEDILYELFLQAGPLVSVKRMSDKSFAFVEFKHDVSVPYAKNIMTGTHLFNKELRLQFRSGSVHHQQQQSQRQPPNYHRSNSYPNPQGQSPQYQQNMNMPQFQVQDPRQAMFFQQQFHGQAFDNSQQGSFQNRNENNDFRRSPQYHRSQSYNEQDFDARGHQGYDSGRSRHHDRGHDDRRRHSGGHTRHHSRNEPQEIIQKQMRRSAESGMRQSHSSGSRGHYQDSRSGGHHYRR